MERGGKRGRKEGKKRGRKEGKKRGRSNHACQSLTSLQSFNIFVLYPNRTMFLFLPKSKFFGLTVKPPNKGHFGNGSFVLCSEVVPISEVQLYNPQIMFYGPKPYIDKMKELADSLTASGLV